ncbi:MAG: hypothetical protein WD399_07620, partial [Thermoleophilaceae bacterium]
AGGRIVTAAGILSYFALRLTLRFALRLTLRFALGFRSCPATPDRAWLRGVSRSLTYIPQRGCPA